MTDCAVGRSAVPNMATKEKDTDSESSTAWMGNAQPGIASKPARFQCEEDWDSDLEDWDSDLDSDDDFDSEDESEGTKPKGDTKQALENPTNSPESSQLQAADIDFDDVDDLNLVALLTEQQELEERLALAADIDDLLDLDNLDRDWADEVGPNIMPLYPMGELRYLECGICMETKDLYVRTCCSFPVCDDCMLMYITTQVEQAQVKMGCPNGECVKFVHRDEIMVRLTGPIKEKFFKFLVDANKEAHIKTCPKCSTVTTLDTDQVRKPGKHGLEVVCVECELRWCFVCQAPWHEGLTCRQYIHGDRLLNKWAKEHHFGQANAQKCPRCKVSVPIYMS